jgi:hypothetical protein
MSTFGNVSELWMVARKDVNISTSNTANFFLTERAAKDFAKETASRNYDLAIYLCKLNAYMVIDSPREVLP